MTTSTPAAPKQTVTHLLQRLAKATRQGIKQGPWRRLRQGADAERGQRHSGRVVLHPPQDRRAHKRCQLLVANIL